MALFNRLGGMFTDNPVNRVGPTGQPLMGGSNITDLLTRSAGGLLGRDVRQPEERVRDEIAAVEDKGSVAGLKEQAQLFANLGTPQGIQMALQLTNQATDLQKLEKDAADLAAKKLSVGTTLTGLGLTEVAKQFAERGLSLEDAQDAIDTERDRKALAVTTNQSVGKQRQTKMSIAKNMGADSEFLIKVAAGSFDEIDTKTWIDFLNDEVGIGKGASGNDKSFTTQNWVVSQNGGPERAQGISFESKSGKFRHTDDKLYTKAQLENQFGLSLVRKTSAAGSTSEETFSGGTVTERAKDASVRQAIGATERIATIMESTEGMGKNFGLLLTTENAKVRSVLSLAYPDFATKASNLNSSIGSVGDAVGRALSGAAIKDDEFDRLKERLTPVISDFNTPEAVMEKLITTTALLEEIRNSGLQGQAAINFLDDRLTSIARDPITNEVRELINQRKYREALIRRLGKGEVSALDADAEGIMTKYRK
tara:strand:+ start:32 stop:1474 length:1443 start_codon:yes stop_codon:yes gene_type:complete